MQAYTRNYCPTTYIHYGASNYDISKFNPIKNRSLWIKPEAHTGLWASPIDSERSWKQWCDAEHFKEYHESESFKFTVKDPNKIFFVNSKNSYNALVEVYGCSSREFGQHLIISHFIDYEKMISDGFDGLEIAISSYERLYDLFYGWDCDSILMFNKNAIEEVTDDSIGSYVFPKRKDLGNDIFEEWETAIRDYKSS